MKQGRRILVIRYGGFGDLVMSMGAFRAIRAHHRGDHVAALTTRPYRDLLQRSGQVDEVLIDERLKPWQLGGWARLIRRLRGERFDRVYDLQRNQRTSALYRLMRVGRSLEWSGVVRGASHFIADDRTDRRHVVEKFGQQLRAAGIARLVPDDFHWLSGEIGRFDLPVRYGLIVSGGAPHRPEKRAPAASFAALGRAWLEQGIIPVLLGTGSEHDQIAAIAAQCPGGLNLCERTDFGDIAGLARHALIAVGNDTGVMHLAAAVGCPALVLFSAASEPDQIRPLGRFVRVLRETDLRRLAPAAIIAEASEMIAAEEASAEIAPRRRGRK